ncbi:MAG: helix-turn-helix domain-containing protein [Lachnospiraceae bacterium]
MNFSQTLRSLLSERHLTQKTVSSSIGIAQNTLSSYINGKRQPDLQMLCSLADYFGVSIDYMLGYVPANSELTSDQMQLIEITSHMSEENIRKLIQIANILAD